MHMFIKIIAQHHHHTHELHSSAIGGPSPNTPPSWGVPDCSALQWPRLLLFWSWASPVAPLSVLSSSPTLAPKVLSPA